MHSPTDGSVIFILNQGQGQAEWASSVDRARLAASLFVWEKCASGASYWLTVSRLFAASSGKLGCGFCGENDDRGDACVVFTVGQKAGLARGGAVVVGEAECAQPAVRGLSVCRCKGSADYSDRARYKKSSCALDTFEI